MVENCQKRMITFNYWRSFMTHKNCLNYPQSILKLSCHEFRKISLPKKSIRCNLKPQFDESWVSAALNHPSKEKYFSISFFAPGGKHYLKLLDAFEHEWVMQGRGDLEPSNVFKPHLLSLCLWLSALFKLKKIHIFAFLCD